MRKLYEFLGANNPFIGGNALMNIVNGITASSKVNVDDAKDDGNITLASMLEKHLINTFRYDCLYILWNNGCCE